MELLTDFLKSQCVGIKFDFEGIFNDFLTFNYLTLLNIFLPIS
jgi:hypothetical protein